MRERYAIPTMRTSFFFLSIFADLIIEEAANPPSLASPRILTQHVSPSDAFEVHMKFLVLSAFHARKNKAQYFPKLKKHEVSAGERGAL